jgi:multidrug transporter EmrE-like cation transporter
MAHFVHWARSLGWIYLLLAGCCEIYAAAIPRTDGFTRLWPGSVPAEGEMTP